MTVTDLVLISALIFFLLAWWKRSLKRRATILMISALIAFLSGIADVLDYRWQDAAGAAVAGVFMLILFAALAFALIYLSPVPDQAEPV